MIDGSAGSFDRAVQLAQAGHRAEAAQMLAALAAASPTDAVVQLLAASTL